MHRPGFTEYCQTWLRHWRLDNSITQRGVTSDNPSRPLAIFPKTVCRVSSRQGASINVFRSQSENAKYFTVVTEFVFVRPLCIIQNLIQQKDFRFGVGALRTIDRYTLPRLMVTTKIENIAHHTMGCMYLHDYRAKPVRPPPYFPPLVPPGPPPSPPQLANMPVCSKRRYYWIIDYPIGEGELQ